MLLVLDECLEGKKKVLGCLCLPSEIFPDLEKQVSKVRLVEKLWGELKWNKITDGYFTKYSKVISNYFSSSQVTFHSWSFEIPDPIAMRTYYENNPKTVIYKQAYLLIRSVIRKCNNAGYTGSFYILPDETGSLGNTEYRKTQKLLTDDTKIQPKAVIDYCMPGNSACCGALQVVDLCTGAVNCLLNNLKPSNVQKKLIEALEEINGDISIISELPTLPKLYEYKMHYFNCVR